MKNSTIVWIVIVAVIIVGGAWYLYSKSSAANSGYSSQTSSQNQTAIATTSVASTTAATTVPVLAMASSTKLGSYLTAPNGMTLYRYTRDISGVSKCTGKCALIWPPYTLSAGTQLSAAAGISGSLATTTRTNGTMQLTYNGKPLYYYSKDSKAGDTKGQGIAGTWFVVAP